MIDEVDLHLHPRWQARILEDLVRIFPNVQFIVTTHSPVVVASVPRGNIRILGEDAATVPAMETRGRDAGDIAIGDTRMIGKDLRIDALGTYLGLKRASREIDRRWANVCELREEAEG